MDVKEKLVELLDNFPRDLSPFAGKEKLFVIDDNIEQAEYLIANGVTVQDGKDTGVPTKWIPVTEQLPENDVMVIGYTPCDGYMFIGYYHEEPKYDWKVWRIVTAMRSTKVMKKKVTHWLPLPQPPKEG